MFDFVQNTKPKRRFAVYSCILVLLGIGVLFLMHSMQLKNDKAKAAARGESISAAIQNEMSFCYNTTELMVDLYEVNGEEFLKNFENLCAELQNDNLAIGSMYWAPNAVINYAYPEKVTESTRNFEMLKDPVQGPKAQKAIKDRKTTIAGPHKLVEGGKGFIIRNPYFDSDGHFVAFAIMVIDTEMFLKKVIRHLDEEELNYRFAVWKDDDPTAECDSLGYIFCSNGPIKDREITVTFHTPNDIWHLTLEPVNGWTSVSNMRNLVAMVVFVVIILLVFLYFIMKNLYLSQEMGRMENERKRANEAENYQKVLMKARDAAEAANRAKTMFLNNMSHDIRTPMNAILGFAHLMEKNKDNPEVVGDYLEKIINSGEYLLAIINNVLDMARIDSGKTEIDNDFFDMKNDSVGIFPVFEDTIRKKNLKYTSNQNIQHRYLMLDRTKVMQIMMNLISNAVKYTPDGGSIAVELNEIPCEREGYARFVFKVSDTGIGMSKEFCEHIFDYFSRERNTTESKVAGTGLGMSIVKKLVDLMGGTIVVESELGKGSTFTITLDHKIIDDPQPYIEHRHQEQQDNVLLEGRNVLMAEDNELNAEIATVILEDMGLHVDCASDGVECIKKLVEAESGYYDIILMDIQMPNLNGYDAARRIRELDDLQRATIPIVAMTANAFEEDRRKAFDNGMNAHLAKPIDAQKVLETLSELLK